MAKAVPWLFSHATPTFPGLQAPGQEFKSSPVFSVFACLPFIDHFLLERLSCWWLVSEALGTLLIVNDFCVFKSLELSPITCVFNPVGQEAMGRASELSSRAASSPVSQVKWKLGLKATNI